MMTNLHSNAYQRVACELTGLPPKDLLKVRATNDSLVVIIHTGQKFIYGVDAIQSAADRLAAGIGRFTEDFFREPPEVEQVPAPEVALPVVKSKVRSSKTKLK
jgi:hypothetical protein